MVKLRIIEVDIGEGEKISLREPRIKDYLASQAVVDEQERTVVLLAGMVLNEEGRPIGREGVDELPLSALAALAQRVPELIGVIESPLDPRNVSSTG